jgi:hypothetical protein
MAEKQEQIDIKGKGVEVPSIKSLDGAISDYESEKDKRCKISPREVAAKGKLQDLLHKNREKLPVNEDGFPYYRYEGRDYTLQDALKITKVKGAETE